MPFDTGASEDRVLRVLGEMRRTLDQRGWVQGRFVEHQTDPNSAFCALGHMRLAAGSLRWSAEKRRYVVSRQDNEGPNPIMDQVLPYLKRALEDVDPAWVAKQPMLTRYDTALWNDHPKRTADDVRRLFEWAYELRQQELARSVTAS